MDSFLSKVALTVGAVGIAFSAYTYHKFAKVADKVGTTVSELSDKTTVEIKESLVESAVQKAVDREVEKEVMRASKIAVASVSNDIRGEVNKAVRTAYPSIEKSVSDETAKMVARLNIGELKEEVSRKAKEAVLEKFNGSLDDVLDQFNNNLGNVSKIYNSIAESLTKKQQDAKSFTFKLD